LQRAEQEEMDFQKQQAEFLATAQMHMKYGKYISLFVALFAIMVWIRMYARNGKPYSVRAVPDVLYDLPSDDPPALVGWLMQMYNVNGSHVIASMFDLASRGYFSLHEEPPGKKKFLQKSDSRFRLELTTEERPPGEALQEWERDLYDFILDSMHDGSVYFDELTDQRSRMSKWFTQWAKKVKEAAKALNWIDDTSTKAAIFCGIIELGLFGVGIFSITWAKEYGLIGTAVALFAGVFSIFIRRRTPEGEKLYQQWKAFKRGFKMTPASPEGFKQPEKPFIYAIATGVKKSELENWLNSVPGDNLVFPWIFLMPDSHSSPAALATSMTTLVSTGLQSVSSVAGGSGATAGVAGGGAGGGAG